MNYSQSLASYKAMKYATQTIHGMARTRFYRIYTVAKARCENPSSDSYIRYGAKGITFDFKDFVEFKEALYDKYLEHAKLHGEKDTTIERIDRLQGYNAENCTWATMAEQARNRSNTVDADGLAGVEKIGKKWMARRSIDGKQKYLGIFTSPQEAHRAYLGAV